LSSEAKGVIWGAMTVVLLADDSTVWERDPLERLAQERGLCTYKHRGYWQYLDTLRDKFVLEEAWRSENPPWKVW
jgi:glucose-1-phosphate cytidylyltransferase